jgi:hypothetical protein
MDVHYGPRSLHTEPEAWLQAWTEVRRTRRTRRADRSRER